MKPIYRKKNTNEDCIRREQILEKEMSLNLQENECLRVLKDCVISAQDEKIRTGGVSAALYARIGIALEIVRKIRDAKDSLERISHTNRLNVLMNQLRSVMDEIGTMGAAGLHMDAKRIIKSHTAMQEAADSTGKNTVDNLNRLQLHREEARTKENSVPQESIYQRQEIDKLIAGGALEDVLNERSSTESVHTTQDLDDILEQLEGMDLMEEGGNAQTENPKAGMRQNTEESEPGILYATGRYGQKVQQTEDGFGQNTQQTEGSSGDKMKQSEGGSDPAGIGAAVSRKDLLELL